MHTLYLQAVCLSSVEDKNKKTYQIDMSDKKSYIFLTRLISYFFMSKIKKRCH